MRRQVLRFVVGFVLMLLLAGCGGDPKAQPPPITSSATNSPISTSPSPPAMPEAAKADTKAGAIAFVRHYIELINYAQATGDVSALEKVEDAGCESCRRGREVLKTIYDAGGTVRGGSLTFTFGAESRSPRYKGWLVSGSLSFGPQSVTRKAGAPAQSLGGGTTPVNAFVSTAASGGWRVMEWTRGS